MNLFYAALSNGGTIKRTADKMEIVDNSIRVYVSGEVVAYMDLGTVLYAHIY